MIGGRVNSIDKWKNFIAELSKNEDTNESIVVIQECVKAYQAKEAKALQQIHQKYRQ
jgi:hypothetical protein